MAARDCERVKRLNEEISRIKAEIDKTRNEANELGFGTAQLMRMIVSSTELAKAMDALANATWPIFVKFLKDGPDALKDLDVAQIKAIIQVLLAQAKLIKESIDNDKDRRMPGLKAWIAKLENVLANWNDSMGQADAIAKLKDLYTQLQGIKLGTKSWLLDQLKAVFTDDLLKAAGEELEKRKKQLFKQIAYRIVAIAVGKTAADKFNKWIGVALTGWELLVEMAANGQIDTLREYIDRLMVERVKALVDCGYKWPEQGPAYFFPGRPWLDREITMRVYVQCGRIVDGKLVWLPPCQLCYTREGKPLSLTFTIKQEHWITHPKRGDGFQILNTGIDLASLAACEPADAKYCYIYDVVEFMGVNGPESHSYARGAKKDP